MFRAADVQHTFAVNAHQYTVSANIQHCKTTIISIRKHEMCDPLNRQTIEPL